MTDIVHLDLVRTYFSRRERHLRLLGKFEEAARLNAKVCELERKLEELWIDASVNFILYGPGGS